MLHNTTNKVADAMLERFLSDVEKLHLRFPTTEIAEKTGYNKGNISKMLNGKLHPSQDFLNAFYEKFGDRLPAPDMYTQTYTTKQQTGAKKPDDSDIIRHYQELVKQLQETVKQQNDLIYKLLQKT